jgi:Fe-S cluster assembly iron-binding protein IscA
VAARFAVSAVFVGLWHFLRRQHKADINFEEWLTAHADAIRSGGSLYKDSLITPSTDVYQYECVLSIGFFYVIPLSPRFVAEDPSRLVTGLLYAFCSLLMGWCGIKSLFAALCSIPVDLSGGRRHTIAEISDEIEGHRRNFVRVTPAAADAARAWMTSHGYRDGSAIAVGASGSEDDPRYLIQYDDQLSSDGRYWLGESEGVLVLVEKKSAQRLSGFVIDYRHGAYVFEKRGAMQPAYASDATR